MEFLQSLLKYSVYQSITLLHILFYFWKFFENENVELSKIIWRLHNHIRRICLKSSQDKYLLFVLFKNLILPAEKQQIWTIENNSATRSYKYKNLLQSNKFWRISATNTLKNSMTFRAIILDIPEKCNFKKFNACCFVLNKLNDFGVGEFNGDKDWRGENPDLKHSIFLSKF